MTNDPNAIYRALDDHAEQEILEGAPAFIEFLWDRSDLEQLARAMQQMMVNVWKGEEGLVRAREIASQWEHDYKQFRQGTLSDAECNEIAEAA